MTSPIDAAARPRGAVVWCTGLSGAGKTTLCRAVEQALLARGRLVQVLDGDLLRQGLCRDLGFTAQDRSENIRRAAEVAALSAAAGLVVLVALISPFRRDRQLARQRIGSGFVEVFLDVPLPLCEARDAKGLYRRARAGQLPEFTGIGSPYEPPEAPELRLDPGLSPAQAAAAVLDCLTARGLLGAGAAP